MRNLKYSLKVRVNEIVFSSSWKESANAKRIPGLLNLVN